MKIKLLLFIFCILLLLCSALYAQVGIGTNKPAASAALEVTSDSNAKGLLIPRLTDIQRAAIKEPAEGLLIYQTSAPSGFYFFTNG
jgi:p-aminobenzoyl-glutamate transporter AbgT